VVVIPTDAVPVRARSLRQLWPALRGDLDIFAPRLSHAVRRRADLHELLADAAVVEVHWGEYAALIPLIREHAPQAVIGLFLHDVVTHARRARARTRRVRRRERLVYLVSRRAADRQEARLCGQADVVWVLKQSDADELSRRGVSARLQLASRGWTDRP
jgi:hypothetical protein